jgi:hypothetical protein
VPLGEILRGKLGGGLPGLHYFIYGLVVIGVILVTPRGLLALFDCLATARRERRSTVGLDAARVAEPSPASPPVLPRSR